MRALSVAAAAVTCLAALTAGCAGKDDEPETAPAGESPSAQTSTSGDVEPSTSPTTATSEPSPADTPLVDRLLPTGLVPGLNAQWKWQDGETGPAGTDQFGVCAKADLGSIGASAAFERSYFPPDDSDDNAAEQVVEFPDEATAARAWSVLKSWHDKCGRQTSAGTDLTVRPMVPVDVRVGSARWYLLSWVPAGEEVGRFEAFGMVRNGTRLALLRMDSSGQDYDYPPGQEPMVGMVQAAAGWLD